MRSCGDCQLCCKLLPVKELDKGANTRCRHQKHGKGCGVYGTRAMPPSCRLWSCRWLTEDKTGDLRRPDRSGYVVDLMPDYVTIRNDLDGSATHLPVLQVWVDPARQDAWRKDRDFIAYLERLAAEDGMAALIRCGSTGATFVAAPALNADGRWFERSSNCTDASHTPQDYLQAGFSMQMEIR